MDIYHNLNVYCIYVGTFYLLYNFAHYLHGLLALKWAEYYVLQNDSICFLSSASRNNRNDKPILFLLQAFNNGMAKERNICSKV